MAQDLTMQRHKTSELHEETSGLNKRMGNQWHLCSLSCLLELYQISYIIFLKVRFMGQDNLDSFKIILLLIFLLLSCCRTNIHPLHPTDLQFSIQSVCVKGGGGLGGGCKLLHSTLLPDVFAVHLTTDVMLVTVPIKQ